MFYVLGWEILSAKRTQQKAITQVHDHLTSSKRGWILRLSPGYIYPTYLYIYIPWSVDYETLYPNHVPITWSASSNSVNGEAILSNNLVCNSSMACPLSSFKKGAEKRFVFVSVCQSVLVWSNRTRICTYSEDRNAPITNSHDAAYNETQPIDIIAWWRPAAKRSTGHDPHPCDNKIIVRQTIVLKQAIISNYDE